MVETNISFSLLRETDVRLTLIISSLHMGGAPRVATMMANYWAQKGHLVTIVTYLPPAEDFFSLLPSIDRVAVGGVKPSPNLIVAIAHNIHRLRLIRNAIQASRPVVVISFMDTVNVLTILARFGLHIPLIISERVDPRYYQIGRFWAGLRFLLYPFADDLVVQTESVRQWALRLMPASKIHCIPNPVPEPPTLDKLERSEGKSILLASGRFIHQKGFDILIRAFAKCAMEHPQWHLRIVGGDGDQREPLEALVAALQLTDRVELRGKSTNILEEYANADLFVLPSRYEGFPNTLLEALTCGLPVIATDCPSGPAEIVRHGIDGLLVPPENVEALASALDELMSDDSKRARLAKQALDVRERFSLEKIMAQWEALIEKHLKA